ncbi:ATP-binding protein [Roseibium litorale]|uniref:AAA family ATPase n=1 Tax=Roseibium litorale TaxID=2803841 RepID=A0ABR9CP91_9HYPH|nr:AAA family ATPase [Roseibium litorale]MBD8892563.1 AAA family ATPase [Roseibium litorale]
MMRLRSLTLDLFGHFSAKTFDFGEVAPSGPDFHVIYGPNEAGKTTSMEGFLRLLYGFPHVDPYGFLHQRKNLRVSGVLDVKGQRLELTRLSNRDGPLRDRNDMILPEAAIQAHLGGLSEADYRQLLCLDDETIEKGGDEIVASNGDIGRLLFSAAAGVSDLTGVLDQFRAKADGLYRKRASSTEVARLKKELAEVEQQIRHLDVPANAYKKLRQALETAQEEEKALREQRQTFHGQKATLEAQRAALPILAECESLSVALADYEDFPRQLEINPEDLVELLTCENKLLGDKERLEADIADLEEELSQLTRHPEHLALLNDLGTLETLHLRQKSADLDLERRRKSLAETLSDMARAARELQAPEGTDPAALVVTAAQMQQMEDLRDTLRDLAKNFSREQDQNKEVRLRLKLSEDRLRSLEEQTGSVQSAGPVLQRYAVDGLAPRFAGASQALRAARTARDEALAGLTISGQSFDNLPASSLSSAEAEELAQAFERLQEQRAKIAERCEEQQRELDALNLRIGHLTSGSGLVDDLAAKAAREERDRLWSAHKADLLPSSASAFETAMATLDKANETRLDHATELGRLRAEEQRQIGLTSQLAAGRNQLEKLDAEIQTAVASTTAQAQASGLKNPVSPTIFALWAAKLDQAAKAQRHLDRLFEEHEATLSAARRLGEELKDLLRLETDEFDTLVSEARRRQQDERTREEERKAAEEVCKSLKAELDRRQQTLTDLDHARTTGEADWKALVADCLGSKVDAGLLLQSLQPLRSLREMEPARAALTRQIESMEADQKAFAREVEHLAQKAGILPSAAPLDTYDQLQTLASSAQNTETTYLDLGKKLDAARADLSGVEAALQEIDGKRSVLAAAFPDRIATGSLQDLRGAVNQAGDVIQKRARLADLTASLQSLAGSSTLEEAQAALKEKSDTDLAAALNMIEQDLTRAEQQLESAIEQRSNAQRDLAAVTGEDDVARLVERKATLELALEDTILTYLETQFGLSLAEEAIRRYRDTHRSSMMEATERTFADLTNGAYTRLTTQPGAKSEILLAIDAKGTAKQAQELSKGTRFQLYLALRAAAYEQLAGRGLCLPFFCDDIFETFDENRTRSACKVMGTIGRTGQAIYLTHHQHVVDIAREVCGSGVTIHTI